MALRQRARDGVELLVDLQSCELGSDTGDDLFDMYSPSGRCVLQCAPVACTTGEEVVAHIGLLCAFGRRRLRCAEMVRN